MKMVSSVLSVLLFAGLSLWTTGLCAQESKIIKDGFLRDDWSLSLSMGIGGLSLGEDTLDVEKTARLGGTDIILRWEPLSWGGLELSGGTFFRESADQRVVESRSLAQLSWLWYFSRGYRHRFYGVTGMGALLTEIHIDETGPYTYFEEGLVLGLGSDWLVSGNWLVSVDIRSLILSESKEKLSDKAANEDEKSSYPTPWTAGPSERIGMVVGVKMGYRW